MAVQDGEGDSCRQPGRTKYAVSDQAGMTEKTDCLARVYSRDLFAEFDEPVRLDQRRQQARALAREFYRFERAVPRFPQGDPDIFAARDLLSIRERGAYRHRDQLLLQG